MTSTRDGAAAARLAHNQEVAGSSPAPATTPHSQLYCTACGAQGADLEALSDCCEAAGHCPARRILEAERISADLARRLAHGWSDYLIPVVDLDRDDPAAACAGCGQAARRAVACFRKNCPARRDRGRAPGGRATPDTKGGVA